MSSVAAELTVKGVVQGVGFRYFCYQRAHQLDLTGWVRNNPDGSVSSYVEGDRGAVEVYVKELKTGPPASSVTDVLVTWKEFSGSYSRFSISH